MAKTKKLAAKANLTTNMSVAAHDLNLDPATQDAVLASMMSDLGGDIIEPTIGDDDEEMVLTSEANDELAELLAVASGSTAALPHDDLTEVIGDIEKTEKVQALYQDAEGDAAVAAGDKPATEAVTEKKTKKEKKVKEPKAPRATSVTHKPGDLLMHKLGDKAGEYLVFTTDDAALDPAALKVKQDEFIAQMNVIIPTEPGYIADKVKDKAVILFSWMKNGGELNEVLKRTFSVLARDGELTSGEKGNSQVDLLAKPYSKGTAASQSNQIFMLFPLLGITTREKGRMTANPNSLILMKARAELGL